MFTESQGPQAHPVFRNHGQPDYLSRRLDGLRLWAAGSMVPGTPPGMREWTPDKDKWELYNVNEDWSQANDLAETMPSKLEDLKLQFLVDATKNKVLPIGGGLWIPAMHPELRLAPPYKEWTFARGMTRMLEVVPPALGNKNNRVMIDADIPANANGVLYALGAFSGGLTTYVKDGKLCYEYNLFEIQRTRFCSAQNLPIGKVKIEVETCTRNTGQPAR